MKKFIKKVLDKIQCKQGSNWVAAGILILLLCVVAANILFPRTEKTVEQQFDKTDERLEDLWNYK